MKGISIITSGQHLGPVTLIKILMNYSGAFFNSTSSTTKIHFVKTEGPIEKNIKSICRERERERCKKQSRS
jgi:hypothetical protein